MNAGEHFRTVVHPGDEPLCKSLASRNRSHDMIAPGRTAMTGMVLVVDDHVRPRRALVAELEDAGFGVVQAGDGVEGWEEFCRDEPDVVITDLVMPRSDGHHLLERIRSRSDVPVILFSAQGSMEAAVSALKAGADDFVSSADLAVEDLVNLVHTAVARRNGSSTLPDLDQRIVGSSQVMQRVRSRMMGLAPLRTPVLVIGEEGTGRDAVVHALHELGSSGDGKLATIDCSAFEPADGVPGAGAVYLDGVDSLPPAGQEFWAARLLEYEQRQFRDAPRVLASSHPLFRLLSRMPYHGYLRPLLMRFPVELPPLRERVEDVPQIANVLVERIARSMDRQTDLSASASEFLRDQVWPRNVRQLEQLLERAVAFCRERQIRRGLLAELVGDFGESLEIIRRHHGIRERDQLIETLQATGGNVSRTAEQLGKSRGAVYRLIEKHGISLTSAR